MTVPRLTARRATGATYRLAEGPLWDAVGQRLLWVDIPSGDVHVGALDDGIEPVESIHVDDTVGAVATSDDGGLLVAGHHRLLHRAPAGALVEVARVIGDDEERRLNDGAVDPAGRYVVGTLSLGAAGGERLVAVEARDGRATVTILDEDLGMSNGVAWSPDGTTLYTVDSDPGVVWQRSYDVATGATGPRRLLLDVVGGTPDGLCVDADGFLWLAVWGAGQVRRLSPTGELAGVVDVPAPHTSCVAFAGPDLDRLVVTTATAELTPSERAEFPASGALFVADPRVRGLPATAWRTARD